MSRVKGRLPATKTTDLAMRQVNVVDSTADRVKRSVRVVTATETPVMRYDDSRGIVVAEVLAMDGIVMRTGKTQLPIVDSHDQSTVRNVLGSLRNVTAIGDEFSGDAVFASTPESQDAYTKMLEGHLTDFSITAEPLETLQLQRGQQYVTNRGTVVDGPANVIVKWTPIDASLVACGADSNSTVRRSYSEAIRRSSAMDPTLLAQLTAMGLPPDITEPAAIIAWLISQSASEAQSEPMMAAAAPAPIQQAAAPVAATIQNAMPSTDEAVARALSDEALRRKAIIADCKIAKLERAFADELCDSGLSLADARERIVRKMANLELGTTTGATRISATESEDDKFYAAARDGFVTRAVKATGARNWKPFTSDKPAAQGYEEFANLDMYRMAQRFLERAKVNTNRMTPKDIALAAMGHQPTIDRCRIERSESAWHTTGSFSNLLLDAANKSLLAGYEEAEYTWNLWARQAPAVPDFKAINRVRFSESPNLEMIPENHDYPEARMSDSKESYRVEKFGSSFSCSWESVVNDDLDALSRVPAMQGNAARRTQNQKVYEVLTSNPVMSDTYNLFSASHASGSNYETTGGAPTVARLNAGFVAMMTQKGINTSVTLNIVPRFLIVPVALHATALEVVGSTARPEVGGSAAGNSNTLNIYGPNGSRPLTVISDPVLDASSAVWWYLAASNSQIDTVELSFLQGEESPVLENEWNMRNDSWFYKIRQTFGVKAIDWRGLYANDGA